MFQMLSQYRVQMCQYHQLRIVQRYLTRNPELPAPIELLTIANLLTIIDKESLSALLKRGVDAGTLS